MKRQRDKIPSNEYTRFLALLGMCEVNKVSIESIYKKYLEKNDVDGKEFNRIIMDDCTYSLKMNLLYSMVKSNNVIRLANVVLVADKVCDTFYDDMLKQFISGIKEEVKYIKRRCNIANTRRGLYEAKISSRPFKNRLNGGRFEVCYDLESLCSVVISMVCRLDGYGAQSGDAIGVWLAMALKENHEKIYKDMHIQGEFGDVFSVMVDGALIDCFAYKILVWFCAKLNKNKELNHLDFEKDLGGYKYNFLSKRVPGENDRNINWLRDFMSKGIEKSVKEISDKFEVSKYEMHKQVQKIGKEATKNNISIIQRNESKQIDGLSDNEMKEYAKYGDVLNMFTDVTSMCMALGDSAMQICEYNNVYDEWQKAVKSSDAFERDANRKKDKLDKARRDLSKAQERIKKLENENKKLSKHQNGDIGKIKSEHERHVEKLNKELFTRERENKIKDETIAELERKLAECSKERDELEEKVTSLSTILDEIEDSNDESINEQYDSFDINANIDEILSLIGNRRIVLVGGKDNWRGELQKYFPNVMCRSTSKMRGKTTDIKSGDIVMISFLNMKHCISVPIMSRCRFLGNLCVLGHETNMRVTLSKLHSALLAEKGESKDWFNKVNNKNKDI